MAYLSLLVFDIEENTVAVNNESIILLSWYQDLHDLAESEEKLIEYLKYIYLAIDPGSIYAEDLDLQRKLVKALDNTTLTKEDVNNKEVATALQEYEYYLSLNTELGLIEDLFTLINSTRKVLRELDPARLIESGTQKGTLMYKPKDSFAIAAQASKVLTSLGELKARMGNEISKGQKKAKENTSKMKADRKPTFYSEFIKK